MSDDAASLVCPRPRQPSTPNGALVVGLDGAATSMRGLAYGVGMARRLGCALAVVHVLTPRLALSVDPVASALLAQNQQDECDALWAQVVDASMPLCGIPVELVAPVGDVVRELARAAAVRQADAVVVGVRQRRRPRLGGSIGARLARLQRWPVLIVP